MGSLPVHGQAGQLGQVEAPDVQVHLVADVRQPQGHLVTAETAGLQAAPTRAPASPWGGPQNPATGGL